jgi:hypothetical protein
MILETEIISENNVTESRRVVNTHPSYWGGPGYKSRLLETSYPDLGFRGFSPVFQANAGIVL